MDIILKNITIIDGTGREPQTDAVLAIRDGKILYVGSTASLADVEGTITLDLQGRFIVPGLIDAHVHLSGAGEADSQFRADDGDMTLKILSNAQKNLAAGITSVRDLGG